MPVLPRENGTYGTLHHHTNTLVCRARKGRRAIVSRSETILAWHKRAKIKMAVVGRAVGRPYGGKRYLLISLPKKPSWCVFHLPQMHTSRSADRAACVQNIFMFFWESRIWHSKQNNFCATIRVALLLYHTDLQERNLRDLSTRFPHIYSLRRSMCGNIKFYGLYNTPAKLLLHPCPAGITSKLNFWFAHLATKPLPCQKLATHGK